MEIAFPVAPKGVTIPPEPSKNWDPFRAIYNNEKKKNLYIRANLRYRDESIKWSLYENQRLLYFLQLIILIYYFISHVQKLGNLDLAKTAAYVRRQKSFFFSLFQ